LWDGERTEEIDSGSR